MKKINSKAESENFKTFWKAQITKIKIDSQTVSLVNESVP